MKKVCHKLFFLLPILLLMSCDCLQKVEGVIYDELSTKPLAEVMIYKVDESYHKIKSDTNGKFQFSDITGGSDCKNVVLVFEKSTYKNDTIVFSSSELNAVVKLRK